MGCQLHEVYGWPGPVTARQAAAWQAWWEFRLEHPTDSIQYLMQIAAEVRRVPSHVWGKRSDVVLDDLRLRWVKRKGLAVRPRGPDDPPGPLTPEEVARYNRQDAAARNAKLAGARPKTEEESVAEEIARVVDKDRLERARAAREQSKETDQGD